MKLKIKIVTLVTTIVFTMVILVGCNPNKPNNKWDKVFSKHNIQGTFVLKNLSNNKLKVYNTLRSDSAFIPASTFKILNSMIALQTAVIGSVNDTIKWDGIDKGWEPWNQDQTMKTAITISCVWFYQELARRIGKEKMQTWVNKADYGNKNIGNKIDSFWLEGDLRISAKEQITFLEKLIKNKLPFDKPIQEIVKEIMVTYSTENYTIHSKTGWANQIGWNVGYVETENNKWIFAMNIDIRKKEETKYRKIITHEILKLEDIIR